MITNRLGIIVGVLAVLIVGWFALSLWKSEEDRIRERLDELADVVSTAKHQTGAARGFHIAQLREFFTEDVTVEIKPDIRKVMGRDTLLQAAHIALQHEPSLAVAFRDVSVTRDNGTEHARVNTTVIVTGVSSHQAKSVDAQELEMELVKAEDEWLIKAIRPVEAMKLEY